MPKAKRTKKVASNTARSDRRWRLTLGSGDASATAVRLARRRRVLDELDPDVVRVEDERDAGRPAREAVGLLRHTDVLRSQFHQEPVEVVHLEREVVQLLPGLELVLSVPVRELDPSPRSGVVDESDLGVEREALVHVTNGDGRVEELHDTAHPGSDSRY